MDAHEIVKQAEEASAIGRTEHERDVAFQFILQYLIRREETLFALEKMKENEGIKLPNWENKGGMN